MEHHQTIRNRVEEVAKDMENHESVPSSIFLRFHSQFQKKYSVASFIKLLKIIWELKVICLKIGNNKEKPAGF